MRSDRTAFRAARVRAASALLAYVDRRSEETESAFIEATHALEAAAARPSPWRGSPRGRTPDLVAAAR